MQARDVMTTTVLAVTPSMPVREVALLLLKHGISAVPVVREDGTLLGMLSEGDLTTRDEFERIARHDWWLKLLAGTVQLSDDYLKQLRAPDRTAEDMMSAPVVTVSESTELADVARLLQDFQIKRVPVVSDGRVVGIVSRADLLHAVIDSAQPDPAAKAASHRRGLLGGLFGEYHRPAWEVAPTANASGESASSSADAAAKPEESKLAAATFRHLVTDFQEGQTKQHDAIRHAAALQRQEQAKLLIDAHVFGDSWRTILHNAREAAQNGASEWMLLRFPNQLCLDAGRAINNAEPNWPATLRGEAAELFLRWERSLKPAGFGLSARVLDFPDGKPGDVGLFLTWGQ
jgi:CBS domain-containing protein